MVRIGLACFLAALAAGPVAAQLAYRNVLPDGRVVYNDTPPGVPAEASPRDTRAAMPDSVRASAARAEPAFGAGARLVVEPQAPRR